MAATEPSAVSTLFDELKVASNEFLEFAKDYGAKSYTLQNVQVSDAVMYISHAIAYQ